MMLSNRPRLVVILEEPSLVLEAHLRRSVPSIRENFYRMRFQRVLAIKLDNLHASELIPPAPFSWEEKGESWIEAVLPFSF